MMGIRFCEREVWCASERVCFSAVPRVHDMRPCRALCVRVSVRVRGISKSPKWANALRPTCSAAGAR